MLGAITKFGSSKGMVSVPDLSNLTLSQAISTIQNAGLSFGGNTTETTGTSSINGLVKSLSQNIAAGTLVNYETSISFIVYSYVYVPPAVYETNRVDSGCISGTPTTTTTCSGYTATVTTTTPRSGIITIYYSNGTTSSTNYACSPVVSTSTVNNSSACGYVSPSCMPSSYSNGCSSCVGGYKSCSTTYIQSDCSTITTYSYPCCSSTSTTYSSWSSCSCFQRYRTVTTTVTCGSSTTTSSSTQWASCTGGQIYGC